MGIRESWFGNRGYYRLMVNYQEFRNYNGNNMEGYSELVWE